MSGNINLIACCGRLYPGSRVEYVSHNDHPRAITAACLCRMALPNRRLVSVAIVVQCGGKEGFFVGGDRAGGVLYDTSLRAQPAGRAQMLELEYDKPSCVGFLPFANPTSIL